MTSESLEELEGTSSTLTYRFFFLPWTFSTAFLTLILTNRSSSSEFESFAGLVTRLRKSVDLA